MPNYAVFKGKHRTFWETIPNYIDNVDPRDPTKRVEINLGVAKEYLPISRQACIKQLKEDRDRQRCISFEEPAVDIKSQLFSPDYYERIGMCYVQGNYTSSSIEAILNEAIENSMQLAISSREKGQSYRDTLSFSYLDDNKIPCGLAIFRFGCERDPNHPHQYVICHTHNIHESSENRDYTVVAAENLTTLFKNPPFTKTVDEANIFNELKDVIRSPKIFQLISTIMEDDKLSKSKFDKLRSRIYPTKSRTYSNLDNRDVRKKILSEWLDCIQRIDPKLAKKTAAEAENDMDFFETTRFEKLLFEKIHVPNWNVFTAIGARLYATQLHYLISEIPRESKQNTEDEAQRTKRKKREIGENLAIYQKLITHNPIFKEAYSYPQVKKRIQRAYADTQFQEALDMLSQYVHECQQPYRCSEAHNLLELCKNVNFNDLSSFGQEQLLTLIETWCKFNDDSKTPGKTKSMEELYNKISDLYKQFQISEPDKDHILQTPEQARVTWVLEQPYQEFAFDPQGRIIYDTVDHQGYRVTVSNDIEASPKLKSAYINTVRQALLKAKTSPDNAEKILNSLQALPSTSTIRPLQQELHIFLSQIAYECQQKYQNPNFNEHDCQDVLNQMSQYVSTWVMGRFASALIRAQEGNTLNVSKINETLNVGWNEIFPDAQNELYKLIATKLERTTPRDISEASIDCPLFRGASTPLVRTDHRLGIANWIDSRHPLPNFTHRYAQSYAFDPKNTSITKERYRTQAIMPTIAFQQEPDAYQQELNEKLTYVSLFYSFEQSFRYYPFLNYKNITAENLQKTVLATHNFNRHSITTLKEQNNFESSLVLGFCNTLSMMPNNRPLGYRYYEWSALGNEATLMTEMALIQQLVPSELNTEPYKAFLVPESPSSVLRGILAWFRPSFFSQTTEGKQTIATINTIKKTWQEDMPIEPIDNIDELLAWSLKKIMAFDLHFSSEFNTLTQALTLAQDKQSLVAHSDHSRASYFLGLIQIFDQQPSNAYVKEALQQLVWSSNMEDAKDAAANLQTLLAQHYLDLNTYGAARHAITTDAGAKSNIPNTAQALIEQANSHNSYSRVIETMPALRTNPPSSSLVSTTQVESREHQRDTTPINKKQEPLVSPPGVDKPPRPRRP